MNIYILDLDPVVAARSLCDQHVVKMLVESAQMLSSAYLLSDKVAPYKPTFLHHPCTIWVKTSRPNFHWLAEHASAMAEEFTFRYGTVHRSGAVVAWCIEHAGLIAFPQEELTPFAQAMPDQYKDPDPVRAYRAFYRAEKRFAVWRRGRPAPDWW